jgi:hypothetical protein
VQRVLEVVVLERLADHELVAGVVLDEQDDDHAAFGLGVGHRRVSFGCRRSNIAQTRSACCRSITVSSSQQRTTHSFPSRRASTRTLVAALQEPASFPGCGTFGA